MTETQNASYRRGLVLGLTVAEIAFLIIFVLLLAFAALLAGQQQKRKESEQVAEARKDTIAVLRTSLLTAQVLSPYREKNITELVSLLDAKRQLSELQQAVESSGFSPEPDSVKKALEGVREYEDLKSAIQEQLPGGETNIEDLQRELVSLLDTKRQLSELQQAVESSGFSPEPDSVKKALKVAAQHKKLETAGSGTEVPSCWTGDEGTIEYIYNVNLTSSGLIIHDTELPHRTVERRTLPIQNIVLGVEISERTFLATTSELFEWSKLENCRFFVKVFDSTGPTEKTVYQSRLRTVESRFYKYNSSSPF